MEDEMKAEKLERLAMDLKSEHDRDRVEAMEYLCDIAQPLIRRLIAAYRMREAIRGVHVDFNDHEQAESYLSAIAEWDASH